MKKTLPLLIFAMLLAAGAGFGQKRLSFGVTGTGMLTGLSNQHTYYDTIHGEMDWKPTLGFAGCVNVGFDFNKNLGLMLQLGYSGLGQSYEDAVDDTVYVRDIKLNYFQIPLMFKFRTSGEVARFYVMAGPQINILFSAKQNYYKNDLVPDDEYYNPNIGQWVKVGEEDITDRFNSIDVMGRLDLGAEVSLLDNLYLNGGLSFAYGFMDVNADDWKDSDGNSSNNFFAGFHVGINYCFEP